MVKSPVLFQPSPFQPSFQVDSFAWPSGCTRLTMMAADQVDRMADALTRRLEQGQQVVALGGSQRGDGCTTLLLSVARRLAERGLNVAIVDADFENPLLARIVQADHWARQPGGSAHRQAVVSGD